MTPIWQEDIKKKTEMKDTKRELNMNELEMVNGGVVLASLLVGALVAGTITLFGVTAAINLKKDD